MPQKAVRQHILIIDGKLTALQELLELLASEFFLSTASSTAEAWKLLSNIRPDLILIDSLLPDVDGFEFFRQIGLSPSLGGIPVIFHTAQHDDLSEAKAFAAGAADYIRRPCNPLIVLHRIKSRITNQTVTDRQAEQELLREQVYLRTLINTLPDYVWLKDEQGVFLLCNQHFERLMNANTSQILGKTDADFFEEKIVHAFRCYDRKAIERGGPIKNEEWLYLAGEGHPILLETTKTPMYLPDGRLIGVLGVGRDITQHHQALLTLQQRKLDLETSESNFRQFFNTIDHMLLVLDEQGKIVTVNQAVTRKLGFATDDLLGKNIIQFHPVQIRAEVAELLHATTSETPSVSFSVTIRKKDGTPLPVEVSTFLGAWARETAYFCIMKDVSALQAREQQYQQLFAEMLCAMMVCEVIYDEAHTPQSFRLIHINPAAEKVLGVSRDACLHKTREEFSWGWPEEIIRQYYTVAETGQPLCYVRHNLKFGGYYDTKVFAPRKGQFAILFLDITEQVISEKKLMMALKNAEQANREIQNFYATVAHEFRTPLTLISVSSGILKNYADRVSAEERENLNEQIDKAIVQLSSLVESVLGANKIKNTKGDVTSVLLDIKAACTTIADGMRIMFGPRRRLTVDLAADCGQILCDEMLFRQVVENLLVNAFRYTPDSGRIWLTARRNDTCLLITIKDTGIGIPEQDLPHISEAFYRGSNVSAGSGLGLGLSIVHEALKKLQGCLEIRSSLAAGTTVTIALPPAAPCTEESL